MTDICSQSALLSLSDALNRIQQALTPILGEESIILPHALGRLLSQPCYASFSLPAFPNSSMDGYALHSSDIQAQSFSLKQVGISWAGQPYTGTVNSGECIRIFTGAVLPSELDSVVMQEQVLDKDNVIYFPEKVQAQQNIRHIGEDIQAGDELLPASKNLTAIDLGLLAASGIYELKVKRQLRMAFFSTGDELTAIGTPLKAGQIYDSNRYTLNALLTHPCYSVTDLGVLADDKQLIKQTLLSASEEYDVIISTGGASVGDADFIKIILDEIGQVNFWKLALKPGKPLAFGHINQCAFFGLPGNPISVLATFQQVVTPALRALSGQETKSPLHIKARCKSPLYKQAGRQEFQRGIFKQTPTGEFEVISAGKQGSNILSSSSRANCYIVLSQEQGPVAINETVIVEPFTTLV